MRHWDASIYEIVVKLCWLEGVCTGKGSSLSIVAIITSPHKNYEVREGNGVSCKQGDSSLIK
jgi:hypothetical protein